MEKLDLERPYGTVYGDAKYAHEQDGIFFAADGSVVEKWSTPEKIEGERRLAIKRKAKEAALALKREQREIRRKLIEEL